MKKLLSLVLAFALSSRLMAADAVEGIVNHGSTGTTSATVIINPGKGPVNLTDLDTRVDAGNNSATVDMRIGKGGRQVITSATATSLTQLWFDNSASLVAAEDYLIFEDQTPTSGSASYTLLHASAVATTSITTYETISVATTTSDHIYTLNARIRRPAPAGNASTTVPVNIWLPAGVPSALTLDGNTTSCQISTSGVRGSAK